MGKVDLTLHLISDSTGWTVVSAARSAIEHFPLINVSEFVWSFVNSKKYIDQIIKDAKEKGTNPFVIYTISDDELRGYLKCICKHTSIPCVPVLSQIISGISSYLEIEKKSLDSANAEFSNDYLSRIDAINYAVAHDDGQSFWNIENADIVIVGVSRTSKSPTSVYMAYHGYKVANIPFVPSIPFPVDLDKLKDVLVVGLTIDIDSLLRIRQSRVLAAEGMDSIDYVNRERIEEEINEAIRFFRKQNWQIIDVTGRSIEEVSSILMQMYGKRKR